MAGTVCGGMPSAMAGAASFDCTKAATYAEKSVCANVQLGKLDEPLSHDYASMLTADIGDGGKDLKRAQRQWLLKRNRWRSEQCLADAYRSRIDEICSTPIVRGIYSDCETASDAR